ncbi:MAG: tRNA (N6-isopentenyl adenosine(37)-C2)-methylthiotransferase MiaB [candidate division Zixibacteria bacterium]|nr:tRNA (N6-isopentenyl adenosine(37)-C2)-methylthiotransferase MiaB [candidate division Zixibacteria bacterium]MDH3935716.1 tRNA (N6-isopentenyl adenosine(37)-C2)-methylthiotransferase MiaB [candidate division Zixibacteria bacterium]MDH4033490.1 tRNA (N6-isopentenyl adenosine(37)-C2)-methylthiotransferase MiaB [candidate division Zixibacteria bacterium]
MDRSPRPQTFHITTFGCQMNLADSSTLVSILSDSGYQRVDDESKADLIILNTCSVRDKAEQRVIGRLGELQRHKLARPEMKLAVVGCMAQRLGEDLVELAPHVDIVLGTDRLFELPQALMRTNGSATVATSFGQVDLDGITPVKETAYSAFVTISRGCDNYCSYCIVPYVRGSERAHSADAIVDAVKRLVDEGVVEVTLLGQNVNSYRHGQVDFPRLMKRVARETEIPRLRFMTSHPKDLSAELIDVMASEPEWMPHVHLPLQSGCDRVLKKMGRVYSFSHYMGIVEQLRKQLDYVSLTTDLIVGFPSETEDEFVQTLDAVREIGFDAAFMFRYSVRPGTGAARLNDDVAEEDKIRRLSELIRLQQQIGHQRNQREVGQVRSCLVEGTSRRSDRYLRARTNGNKTVLFEADGISAGAVVPIRISSADAFTLHGDLVEPPR